MVDITGLETSVSAYCCNPFPPSGLYPSTKALVASENHRVLIKNVHLVGTINGVR